MLNLKMRDAIFPADLRSKIGGKIAGMYIGNHGVKFRLQDGFQMPENLFIAFLGFEFRSITQILANVNISFVTEPEHAFEHGARGQNTFGGF